MVYEFHCPNNHSRDVFEHHPEDKGCYTVICHECGHTMGPVPGYGQGRLYFEEGRGRWINNLGPEPVFVTSYKQHRELMKKAGVVEAGSVMPTRKYRNPKNAQQRKDIIKGRWI